MEKEPNFPDKMIWEQKLAEIENIVKAVREEANKLFEKGILKHKFGWQGYRSDIILPELEKRVGIEDLHKYAAFHPLIGSDTYFHLTPTFDLPNNQISHFIRELHEKLRSANDTGKFEL